MEIDNFLQTQHNIILNKQQKQAVNCVVGHTLLLAVPGSGKTTVLVSRIANLILNHSVDPKNILTITFSRETAKDMNKRFSKLFASEMKSLPEFHTIHSFCYNVMIFYSKVKNRKMPLLFSQAGKSQKQLLREIYHSITKMYLSDDLLDNIILNICFAKNKMISTQKLKKIDDEINNFTKIFSEYEKYKKENSLIDYDDMLVYTYQILIKLPKIFDYISKKYSHINIDEAQDTSLVQHKIIKLLSKNATVFMVGDEDQSIYSFRGASPEQLLDFSKNYENAKIIKMEQNFRSNKDIVVQSNFFIKQNKKRYPKEMFCENENKNSIAILKLVDYNRQYENVVEFVKKYSETQTIGILYRNNDTAIPLINEFNKEKIGFYLKEQNSTFFTSYVIKDIFAFIALSKNGKNIDAFKQIYYKCGLNKLALEFVQKNIDDFNNVFRCASKFLGLKDFQQQQMRCYSSSIALVHKLSPKNAIDFICSELGYDKYIHNMMKDGFSKTNVKQKLNTLRCLANDVKTFDEYEKNLENLYKSMKNNTYSNQKSNVILSTLHSAKGQEFDRVILLDMIKDVIPTADALDEEKMGNSKDIENETRLFYVGITRAKTSLTIYTSKMLCGRVVYPSKFITRFENGKQLL